MHKNAACRCQCKGSCPGTALAARARLWYGGRGVPANHTLSCDCQLASSSAKHGNAAQPSRTEFQTAAVCLSLLQSRPIRNPAACRDTRQVQQACMQTGMCTQYATYLLPGRVAQAVRRMVQNGGLVVGRTVGLTPAAGSRAFCEAAAGSACVRACTARLQHGGSDEFTYPVAVGCLLIAEALH